MQHEYLRKPIQGLPPIKDEAFRLIVIERERGIS